jgi:DNA-binding response OmpR family regulator
MHTMLMIDDDPIIRKICETYFTAKGFKVDVAEDGREGLQKFKSNGGKYDVVITDLMMANVHGFQVIDVIKKSAVGNDTPVILLTADKNEPDLENYDRDMYQDDTLSKPFDLPILEKMVGNLLEEFADRKR